ncbi:toll/interleukin-1 receptor domain-containing protein [Actinomadura sp. 7K534]|uniref:toll/interleukin-1 receptor domain-containing protein n=1 Tax=Actinomadura sp. 7K534 TaxID=2530366 RepID=UPI0014045BC7|nr:toll/interleukin-1 receptor domain-containing protein [Actinomadura sp. 7K534]
MEGIFINYRSGNHFAAIERLYDRLIWHFGKNCVFLDRSSIRGGERYPDVLREKLEGCEVLLAVIHPGWLIDADNETRLIDREGDWVRYEIKTALELGKLVIPVRLDDAAIPGVDDLPEELKELAVRQAIALRTGGFAADVEVLIGRLEHQVTPSWRPPELVPPPPAGTGARRRLAVVAAAFAGVAALIVPPVLALAYGRPVAADEEAPLSFQAAMWSALFMTSYPIIAGLLGLVRTRINNAEQIMHPISSNRYNSRFAIPVGMTTVALLSMIILAASGLTFPAYVTIMVLLVTFAGYVVALVRAERDEEDEERNWPRRPRWPITAPALRRGVERVRNRLTVWPAPLNREQQLKAEWSLAVLAEAADDFRRQGAGKRHAWLNRKFPRLTLACGLWIAATVGLFVASLSPDIAANPTRVRYYLAIAVFTGVVLAIFASGGELLYRYWRWMYGNVAAEVHDEVRELRGLLEERGPTSGVG